MTPLTLNVTHRVLTFLSSTVTWKSTGSCMNTCMLAILSLQKVLPHITIKCVLWSSQIS